MRKKSDLTLKPVQQANGKRFPEQARGRLLRLHSLRVLFALFSAACCACTALVIFSLSVRLPASLARPLTGLSLLSACFCFLPLCSFPLRFDV